MESFLNRYRNITVLLLVILAQVLLLAVQVKNDQDVHLIRVWTVTAVTPMARILEGFRGGSIGFVHNYITLHDADADNRRLQAEVDRLKIENIFLKNELNSADRAKALQVFQAHTPSKMLAATVISTGAGSNSKVVFVDRGSGDGLMRGMAVVTPDGIVGKVIAVYPLASEVLLVTDADFAAGVVSQKSQARGTFKGQGTPLGKVDYVPSEEKVAPGEWFYTSGDDRVFPRGFPVGQARAVRPGQPFQEILVEPAGLQRGLEDVLIVVAGVHQDIPDTPPVNQPVYIAPPPPAPVAGSAGAPADASGVPLAPGGTEADKLRQQYKAVGDEQKHRFGDGEPGSLPPDFKKLGQPSPVAPATAPNRVPAAPPAGSGTNDTPKKTPGDPGGTPAATGGHAPGAGSVTTDPATAPVRRSPDSTKKPPPNPSGAPLARGSVQSRDREGVVVNSRLGHGTSGPADALTPPVRRPIDLAKKPPANPSGGPQASANSATSGRPRTGSVPTRSSSDVGKRPSANGTINVRPSGAGSVPGRHVPDKPPADARASATNGRPEIARAHSTPGSPGNPGALAAVGKGVGYAGSAPTNTAAKKPSPPARIADHASALVKRLARIGKKPADPPDALVASAPSSSAHPSSPHPSAGQGPGRE